MEYFLLLKNTAWKKGIRPFSVFIFFMCCWSLNNLMATHIVGGEINYECLGGDDYRFTMKMYRNCNSQGTGQYPNPAPIAIYLEESNGTYTLMPDESGFFPSDSYEINLEPGGTPEIDIPELPCLEPPEDVCVQTGTYIFEANLPLSNRSYHIIFQRCCRNGSITNILEPGDVGVTFTIELTPEAQASCNNSPIFNEFPPIVICANEPLSVDQSATDVEGDQLVYELCAPLKGGGKEGTQGVPGDDEGCNGFRPNPACPPPFDEVDFIVPAYTSTQPMGGAPIVSINPITGEITGIPTVIGQFVVGVCVKEFRDGVLLSTTRRDFQFNVEQCDPFIDPIVEADEILDDNTFVINSCGENIIQIDNQSTSQNDVEAFFWEFDLAGNMELFSEWNPELILPDTGTYEGFLYINPGSECGDTARVLLNYYPEANADFLVEFDTCSAGEVSFTDESMQGTIPIETWNWNLGNGTVSTEENPIIDYETVGTYLVQLNIEDVNGCTSDTVQQVDWFPAPDLIVIEPSSFLGCPPADIFFNNLTETIDNTYDIQWSFGDGVNSTEFSPSHVYDTIGSYSINVNITSPLGCLTTRSFPNWINITPEPVGAFDYQPNEIDNFSPEVQMIDSSLYSDSWYWNFDDESDAYIQSPSYVFRDTGLQRVELIVTHPNGCADTTFRIIDVVPKVTYYLPNAFSPNGDGLNDVYQGKGYLDGISDFHFEIWNRWGEQIFLTTEPTEAWNGTKANAGQLSPSGTYQCFAHFTGPRGASFEFQTFLTLIR